MREGRRTILTMKMIYYKRDEIDNFTSARRLYVSVCVYVCIFDRKKQERGENKSVRRLDVWIHTCLP